MKRLLLVLASSAGLSAWGQAGLEAPKGAAVSHEQHTTVLLQGVDGQMHEVQVPSSLGQLKGGPPNGETVDLQNVTGAQAGCPVQIMTVSFERPGQLMLTSQSKSSGAPTLRLNYRNFSGKDIESVTLTGWVKVKDSPYQLDSVTHPFQLQLSRKALLGKDVQATQALKLAANAVGMDRVELSQVIYADGTSWKAERRNCIYRFYGENLGIAR